MSQIRRIQRCWKPWLAAALVVLLAGCGNEAQSDNGLLDSADGGAGGGDASFEGTGGAGGAGAGAGGPITINGNIEVVTVDAVTALAADPARSALDLFGDAGIPAPASMAYGARAAACYATPEACTDEGCSVFPTCCVGNGTCCKPIDDPPLPAVLDFRNCSGLDVEACAAGNDSNAVVFGPSQPVINSRGFVPGGNASTEGGAIVGDLTDLGTTRVRIDVEFALPIGCGESCLESAGVTFSNTPPGTFVDAEVGLLLSGSRHEVNLMIGNAIADTFEAGSGQTRWALVLSPEGRVEVLRNDVSQAVHSFDADGLRDASLLVFGRNLSATSNSAAVARLELQTSFCDIPSSWDLRAPTAITDEVGNPRPGDRFGRGPSVAYSEQEVRFAYSADGEIFWGRSSGVGSVELISSAAALSPTAAHEALGIADPELVHDGNVWHMFYTARGQDGTSTIGHATATSVESFLTADPSPTLHAGDASLDAPTVHHRDGLWILIARATLPSGQTELRGYYTNALNTGWVLIFGTSLEALTRVVSPGSEVTDPSLIVHNGAYQLYFSRRSGTRWSVELLMSDELLLWRPLGDVMGGSGEGFDRLGAKAPDAISLTDRIELVYEGQSGASFELGWAVRSAPSDTTSDF